MNRDIHIRTTTSEQSSKLTLQYTMNSELINPYPTYQIYEDNLHEHEETFSERGDAKRPTNYVFSNYVITIDHSFRSHFTITCLDTGRVSKTYHIGSGEYNFSSEEVYVTKDGYVSSYTIDGEKIEADLPEHCKLGTLDYSFEGEFIGTKYTVNELRKLVYFNKDGTYYEGCEIAILPVGLTKINDVFYMKYTRQKYIFELEEGIRKLGEKIHFRPDILIDGQKVELCSVSFIVPYVSYSNEKTIVIFDLEYAIENLRREREHVEDLRPLAVVKNNTERFLFASCCNGYMIFTMHKDGMIINYRTKLPSKGKSASVQ